ncbi:MAG TPA: 30S ribosomal protein S12 methylthiotransferase RimO [Atribacteraceae bacterium]|nr:30S ribosomal protein S12 methylthiotransferase RimO [Atribacteraceae bacterium]
MKTISFVTLGCDKNRVDSEVVLGKLFARGYTAVESPEKADWIILNTCAFQDEACAESRGWIEKISAIRRSSPHKRVLVIGCYPQRFHTAASREFPFVDFWIGINDFPRIVEIIEQDHPGIWVDSPPFLYNERTERVLSTPEHYAYVKIAEGCANRCTFCIIPRIRGPLRSRTIESVVGEVKNLCNRGIREIILLAQDLGAYGLDRYARRFLPDLLLSLGRVMPRDRWLRLLYLSPESLDDRLIATMATVPQVVPFLDIPLQHADPGILRRMGRFDNPVEIRDRIIRARKALPGLVVRTTFLLGFPGEDDAAFQSLLDFVTVLRFERLGAFCYSEQAEAPSAALLPKVPPGVARERYRLLLETQHQLMEEYHQSLVGKTLSVILDSARLRRTRNRRSRVLTGRTYGDAPEVDCRVMVDSRGRTELRPGAVVPVTITRGGRFELAGVIS